MSIVIGFTNGIAVLILISQLKEFLGLDIEMPEEFFTKIRTIFSNIVHIDPVTVIFASVCLFILWFWPKSIKTTGQALEEEADAQHDQPMHAPTQITLRDRAFGNTARRSMVLLARLPGPIAVLVVSSITIALLGAIESLLSARVADAMIDDRHDPNQELMAQGIANIITPFFGGIPATGAIARTATNVRSGGRTPIAGIVHALTLLVIVLVAAPLAKYVPLAALSAVLILVAINMGDWHAFLEMHQLISIDNTGLETLHALQRTLSRRGGQLILCGLNRHPAEQIERSGFAAEVGPENILPHLAAALFRAQKLEQAAGPPEAPSAAKESEGP